MRWHSAVRAFMYAGHSMSVTRTFSQRRKSSAGRQADQLGRPVGNEQLAVAGQAKHGLQVVLEAAHAGPERQSGITAAEGRGKSRVAPAKELLEVQGATFFAGEPCEVAIGRLGLRAHAAKPGCVQVKCTGHVYTLSYERRVPGSSRFS